MSLTTETRSRVRAHVRVLQNEYATVPVFEQTFEILRARFDEMARVAPNQDETIHSLGAFFEATDGGGDSRPADDWFETLPDETAEVVTRFASLSE